jgi:hypothetical protein
MKSAKAVPSGIFDNFLTSIELNGEMLDELARNSGWSRAEPRKITLAQLLLALSMESIQGEASFNDISSRIHLLNGNGGPSRQAVSKRINAPFLGILESLLAKAIAAKADCESLACQGSSFSRYDRVLVQDSTVIRLPAWLFARFSGVSNAHQAVCNARIQATYDVKNMVFVSFEIRPYSDNDLSAAPRLQIAKNDLVLRDRGYLTAAEVARHTAAGADCIYRHKTGTVYLDEETGKPLDLLAELRRNGSLDRMVLLGDKERTRVRLVSAPVSREIADYRRMKAKKEMRGHNPSTEVLALMDWTIFLTTAAKELDFGDIMRIYGLRWRIEIIFKTWKSHLNFDAIHRVSDIGLRSILTMRLVMITEGTNVLYRTCHQHVKRHHDRELSLQKFLKRLSRSSELAAGITRALAELGRQPGEPEYEETQETWNHLVRYCCYDKRKRKNFFDQSNG